MTSHSFAGANNPNYKTGGAIKGSPLNKMYNSWQNMKARCLNPNHPKYHRYGGRGITIEESWLDFSGFKDWAISSGWKEGLTIDRINIDGNYTPDNCQWVTASSNSRRKSTTKLTMIQANEIRKLASDGHCLHDLAERYNVSHGNVWFIVKNFTHVDEGECILKLRNRKKASHVT